VGVGGGGGSPALLGNARPLLRLYDSTMRDRAVLGPAEDLMLRACNPRRTVRTVVFPFAPDTPPLRGQGDSRCNRRSVFHPARRTVRKLGSAHR